MEIIKGEKISDQLAKLLIDEVPPRQREELGKIMGVHVNTITNLINSYRTKVKTDKHEDIIYNLLALAIKNKSQKIVELKKTRSYLQMVFKDLKKI